MHADPSTSWPVSKIKPFLDYLLIECGLAHNTLIAYRADLFRFADFCQTQHLSTANSITPVNIQHYAHLLVQQHLATASIARHLVAVKMFLRFHLLMGQMNTDICSLMETPKTWQRLPKVLSREQTAALITTVDPKDPLHLRDRALLELLYASGIRASEAAQLQLIDVNFQVGFLRVFGKGNKERIVPIHQLALETLRQYLQELRADLLGQQTSPTLFLSRTGKALNRIEIWRIVRRAARRAGMPGKISPHTLRHCFGSHLLQGGADLRSVQEMLGHADVTTTQIYTHVDQDHLRSVHKKYHPRP